MPRPYRLLAVAEAIAPERALSCEMRFAAVTPRGSTAHAIGTLLATAYPALESVLEASPEICMRLAVDGFSTARERVGLEARALTLLGDGASSERVQRELRHFAQEERIRIALRELLPPSMGGADVDVTSRELADLADVTVDIALSDAKRQVIERFGVPRTSSLGRARFTVLGMGKLGGWELNAGSDIDLLFFYDTDDGETVPTNGSSPITLHEFWTRVARRLTATLEEVTADGMVWRVDLRLRPEGRSGPLVNSLTAAERYYEAFGRLWERAALLRARPIAGDRAFGEEVLSTLAPFVWRRRVDPTIAVEMIGMTERARMERKSTPSFDLKLGRGGIREAEFFVQTLQLIWGGKEPRIRARGTLDALRRLRAAGLVTDREAREVTEGYLALRRAEHAVQVGSGLQTHTLPTDPVDQQRLARALGFDTSQAFLADIQRHTKNIAARFVSLLPEGAPTPSRLAAAIAALEGGSLDDFQTALRAIDGLGSVGVSRDAGERGDLASDLWELARHPDSPLGGRTREQFPLLSEAVLEAVVDAADPEQAARYLRIFFTRVKRPGVYIRLLGGDARAARRLVEALGASAFIGDTVANNPELGDVVLFARGVPTPERAREEVAIAVGEMAHRGALDPESGCDDADEAMVGALRRAKACITLEVGLADLSSQMDTREITHTLSALAEAELEAAARYALHAPCGVGAKRDPSGAAVGSRYARGATPPRPDPYALLRLAPVEGFVILAMGKFGGRDIGYGSDLDVIFLFDPDAAPPGNDADAYFARAARRVIQLISITHAAGVGYELDTRLRPSGNQGMLVSSIEAFARYHGVGRRGATPTVKAAAWERLALLRARAVAGDMELGAEATRIAHTAAYEMPSERRAVADEIHRLRMRMEMENSRERKGRRDIKLGRGAQVDVEFAVQLLQIEHGRDVRVRTTETRNAIEALASAGYLTPPQTEALREGYAFLRKLERRIRVVHGRPEVLLEENAPGLVPLARRLGIRDRRGSEATAELLARYTEITERVRATFEEIVAKSQV